jgi:hypothetical protein
MMRREVSGKLGSTVTGASISPSREMFYNIIGMTAHPK